MKFFKDLLWYFKQQKLIYILSIVGAVSVGVLRPTVSYLIRILVDKIYARSLSTDELMK